MLSDENPMYRLITHGTLAINAKLIPINNGFTITKNIL